MLQDQLHAAGRSLWPSHMEVAEVRRRSWLTINNDYNPALFKVCKHNMVSQLCHQRLHSQRSPPGRRLRCSVDLRADIRTGFPCLSKWVGWRTWLLISGQGASTEAFVPTPGRSYHCSIQVPKNIISLFESWFYSHVTYPCLPSL